MERVYKNNIENEVNFFLGKEVEHTPAFGLDTLFVVGFQTNESIEEMLKESPNVKHIYFGANQSFPKIESDHNVLIIWKYMIKFFLDKDYWCTLDFDVSCVEGITESGLNEYRKFISMISVKIPHIQLLNYNATLKIDDIDFQYSNPGVWCHSVHNLKDRNNFTDWDQYKEDEIK